MSDSYNDNQVAGATPSPFAEQERQEISQNYRIVGKQGSGGCSVVYDAWRISDGIHVAIKVLALPADLAEDEAEITKVRFYREARILMSLKDEHSVKCFEYGVFNGAPCVVLEFVDGEQLDDFLRDFGALPLEFSIDIMCQVLNALAEAHEKGVIHRDIKPANIMILEGSDPPVARLLDFGIATLQEGALGELMKTKLGAVRGTPSYMAPELFSGQVPASPESDIYAIGLVLLETLTGQTSVYGASLVQIAFKQAHESVTIPTHIPECLASIIRKCIAKNPDERYHSCHDIVKDLREAEPNAIKLLPSCEAAYLKEIKNKGNQTENDSSQKSSKLLFILLAVGMLIIATAIVVTLLLKTDNSKQSDDTIKALNEATEALKAQQAEQAEKANAAKAEQEAKIREAEAKAKAAEAAAAKAAEEARAAQEAAKAAEVAKAEAEAKAAQEAEAAAQAAAAKKKKASTTRRTIPAPTEPVQVKPTSKKAKTDGTSIPSSLF